jgi:tetratricopeptide (TPR) repeat protein
MRDPRTSRSARSRFWLLLILAGCALLAVLAVVGLAGLRPQRGKLIVEAADPDGEVVVAGEGVVHRQRGSGELALPAGRYEVWCDGKDSAGPSLWVDVPAGGEVEAAPTAPAPPGAARPFVILARTDQPEQAFATLAETAEAMRSGDTIEVRGNGPFVSRPVRIDRPVVIRSAPGFRPVLRLAADAQGALLEAIDALVLEGMELDARPVKGGPQRSRHALAGDGPMRLAFCRIRHEGENVAIDSRSRILHLAHSVVLGGRWHGLAWHPPEGGRLRLEGSLLNHLLVMLPGEPPHEVVIAIDRCTFTGNPCVEVRHQGVPAVGEPPLRIRARDSVLAPGPGLVLIVNRGGEEKPGAAWTLADLGKLLTWRDEGNVYSDVSVLLRQSIQWAPVKSTPDVRTLADWGRAWGAPKIDARLGKVRFAGKDQGAKPDGLPVEAFRLAADSAGKGAGRGGRDAGADVDRLGPGPAYDRWRKSADCRAWLRETSPVPRLHSEVEGRFRALIDRDRWEEAKTLLLPDGDGGQDPAVLDFAGRSLQQRARVLRQRGQHERAASAEQLARFVYEWLLVLRPDDVAAAADLAGILMPGRESFSWEVLKPVKATSEGGATLTPLPDGSLLAGGKSPDLDTYTVVAQTNRQGITAVRLEVVPHPSLPHGGSGRYPGNGNFNLAEMRLSAAPLRGAALAEKVPFTEAWSDYARAGQDIAKAIDGDPETFWEVSPREKEPHTAILVLPRPVGGRGGRGGVPPNDKEGTTLTIQIDSGNTAWKQATLGRFRLSVTTQPFPIRPEQWRDAFARKEVSAWTWLAAAYYHKGEGKAALGILERLAPLSADRSPSGSLLLALVHQQLGQEKEARACYSQGVAAVEAQPGEALLRSLGKEAMQKVAGLPEQKAAALLRSFALKKEEVALTAAVKRGPESAKIYSERGTWYARQGRWKEAAADLTRAYALNPSDNWIGFVSATLLAEVGGRAAYRKHCKELLERFSKTRNPFTADRTAKAWLLLPGTDEEDKELKRVAELARIAVKVGAGDEYFQYFETTLALADYRQGRLTAAEKQAKKAIGKGTGFWGAVIPARLVLAMSLRRRGETAAARQELERAEEQFKKEAPTVERDPGFWQDWVICRLLFREAEGVLSRPADKKEEDSP